MDTVFWTVLSGTATFVAGEIILKLVIEPVQEMKKTIGQIAHALIEHANVISNPGEAKKELIDTASDRLRRLSSLLHSHLRLVPLYRITCWVFWLPCRGSVLSAADSLIKLHNSLHKAIDGIHRENAQDVQNKSIGHLFILRYWLV